MRFLLSFTFLSTFVLTLSAQSIDGHVTDLANRPLPGATIQWLRAGTGAIADSTGYFSLDFSPIAGDKVVASMATFYPDTVQPQPGNHLDFTLASTVELEAVNITDKGDGTFISSITPAQTEIITSRELTKAACCDLAGCFETQATVQSVTTNVITSARELRVLGLSGTYNQVLIEGFPLVMGLSYTYGISTYPGPLISKIYVAKGSNSVLQGSDGITAQLNVLFHPSPSADKLFLNAYGNSFGETQWNAQVSTAVGEKAKWHSLLFTHIAQPGMRIDRDGDGFLDVTLQKRYSLFNTWQYRDEDSLGFSAKIGGMMVDESRTGGQVGFDPRQHLGSDSLYGQSVQYRQPAVFTKLTYLVNEDLRLAVWAAGQLHDQDSWFGLARYDAQQTLGWANAQMEKMWAEKHILRAGASYRYFQLEEDITFAPADTVRNYAGTYVRSDRMPGVFVENTFYLLKEKLTVVAGVRADHHQQAGWLAAPRGVVKWDFAKKSTLRLAAGYGYRFANVFSENINLLASMRNVVFTEMLQPEKALNIGGSFTQKFETDNLRGALTVDFYTTRFSNQVFPDYDSSPQEALISNFGGSAISNGLQAEGNATFFERFSAKVAYNWLDVYRETHHGRMTLPFNARHRLMTSLSYMPLTERWHLDVNAHWFGRQQLASTAANPVEFQTLAVSDPYTQLNAQFTWSFSHLDVYAGCENIFDFRQLRPIVAWQNPFSPYFDTANVWGPTKGREIYGGLRYKL
jgi:outer membrane receptor for ferrienterochelin and colicin